MNHVNLIGKMCSTPKIVELASGKKVAQFTLSTKETYLDEKGNPKSRSQWHQLSAWGRWVKILEELGTVGIGIAVEGKLIHRFYKNNEGEKKFISEVEINDLVIL
jgi:single-strand DNA-binding protein